MAGEAEWARLPRQSVLEGPLGQVGVAGEFQEGDTLACARHDNVHGDTLGLKASV